MSALALGPLGVRIRRSPPLLPLGARVAILGDSICQFNHADDSAGNGSLYSRSPGELVSAQMIDPRFRCDVWLSATDSRASRYMGGANQGIIGDTVSAPGPAAAPNGMLGRLATDILPLKPDICVVAGGTNGVTAGNNLAGLQAICATLASNGIKPVLCTVRPWTPARSGDGQVAQQAMLSLNASIRAFVASTPSVTLCDLATAYGCPGPNWAYAPTSYFGADGLHPGAQGGYVGGSALSTSLGSLLQPGNWLVSTFWSSGTNLLPASSALLNGGPSGAKGNGISGPVATGLTVYAYINSTVVASLIANPTTGGMSQQFVVTPGGTSTSETLPLGVQNNITGVAPSTYYMAFAEVHVDAWPAWSGASLILRETPSGAVTYGMQPADVTTTTTPTSKHLWIATPPFKTSSSATGLSLSLSAFYVPNGATGTGTFTLDRWGVFAMPDPHAIWNS